jgi:hypothetical protein
MKLEQLTKSYPLTPIQCSVTQTPTAPLPNALSMPLVIVMEQNFPAVTCSWSQVPPGTSKLKGQLKEVISIIYA